MEDSFIQYRGEESQLTSDDDSNVIDESNDSSFIALNQKKKGSTIANKVSVIADSGSEDLTENSELADQDVSMVGKPRTKKKFVLLSSESEISEDEENLDDREDNMTMSKATRLSIFGIKPLGAESDDSDFIESENDNNGEEEDSLTEMAPNPHVGYVNPSLLNQEPLHPRLSAIKSESETNMNKSSVDMDISILDESLKIMNIDEEVVAISSDDESDECMPPATNNIRMVSISTAKNGTAVTHTYLKKIIADSKSEKKSASNGVTPVASPPIENFVDLTTVEDCQPKIPSFYDKTYPNSRVQYVSHEVKTNEMNKLVTIRQDVQKTNFLLETLVLDTLPDKGAKLIMRAKELKVKEKQQAEKVSNLIVESGGNGQFPRISPANRIKESTNLTWEDIKSGSTAVQPRMFGEQAMNTHLAQRAITLDRLRDLHNSLGTRPTEEQHATPPRALLTPLMPHQLHALAWLQWRESQKPRGGILADDMGLGKTLTMISLVLSAKENNDDHSDSDDDDEENKNTYPKGGTLVVCPASLLKQWYGEIANHCKKVLKVEIHHGLKRECKAVRLARNDVVITTYNLVQRDLEKAGTLMKIHWARVILDEAHIVRNSKSLTARAVFQLSCTNRWCLTGTPVHNKDLDIFALLKFLKCSPFDDIVLWKKWIDNKSTGGQERLSTVMKSLMLRRTKIQLQEKNSLGCLPTKTTHFIEITLTREEMNVYQKVMIFSRTLFAQFLHQRAERHGEETYTTPGQDSTYYKMHRKMVARHGGRKVKAHEILVLLLRLRQICCHAGLIHAMLDDEQYEGTVEATQDANRSIDILGEISKLNMEELDATAGDIDLEEEATTVQEALSKVLSTSNPVFDFKRVSAKVKGVLKCLEDKVFIHKGDKAIVVSQWTGVLDIVESFLKDSHIKCSTLSGKVPVSKRHDLINQFNDPNSDVQVLMLSLCAGGVGLNLVGGNHLLLIDLHWNPQLENQAQDRIYRVGQKKPVHIYKFMCVDTVEQRIKALQDKKLALAESVLTGAKMTQSSKLSIEDLKLMFNMQ